jgi:hypothetical protein
VSASGRRPLGNRNPAGGSSRRNPQPDALERRSGRTSSGRARPDPEGSDDASAFKKTMFFGTGALVLVVLILVVARWGAIQSQFQEPPKQAAPVVKDDNVELEGMKKEAQTARKMFNDSMRMADGSAKVASLQSAIEHMEKVRDKIDAMGQQARYQSEDFDQVFGPLIDKIVLELREARESLAKAKAAVKNGAK